MTTRLSAAEVNNQVCVSAGGRILAWLVVRTPVLPVCVCTDCRLWGQGPIPEAFRRGSCSGGSGAGVLAESVLRGGLLAAVQHFATDGFGASSGPGAGPMWGCVHPLGQQQVHTGL